MDDKIFIDFKYLSSRVYTGTIYKYRSTNQYTFDILNNSQLYFAHPDEFNDPFDYNLPLFYQYKKRELIRYFEQYNYDQDIISDLKNLTASELKNFLDWHKNSDTALKDKIRISCFSKKPNIIPMWAYYSNSFSGICLGFDPKKDPGLFLSLEVEYPEMNDLPLVDFFRDRNSLIKYYFTKSNHWKHEEEIRVINIQNPTKNLLPFNHQSLVEIILGERISKEDEKKIRQASKKYDLKIKRAVKSQTKFELEIIED